MTDAAELPALGTFIACDSLRVEMFGKVSLLGWFPDAAIAIHPGADMQGKWEPALQSLVSSLCCMMEKEFTPPDSNSSLRAERPLSRLTWECPPAPCVPYPAACRSTGQADSLGRSAAC